MAAGHVSANAVDSKWTSQVSVTDFNLLLIILFVCFCRACIIIGVCFVLSGSAIVSKAVYMLVIDNEPKRVRNGSLKQS